jgi:hypothetical protein
MLRRLKSVLAPQSFFGFARPNTLRATIVQVVIFVTLLAGVIACQG